MHVPFSRTIATAYRNYIAKNKLDNQLVMENYCFSEYRKHMILHETEDWERHYIPMNLTDATVLDVGAGEGETARFYLQHGAKRVIAVEPDTQSYINLAFNAVNHPEITPVHKRFDVGMIWEYKPDLLKCDIEGYEEALLGYTLPCKAVIEVHGLQLRDRFERNGYAIQYPNEVQQRGFGCNCYAYNIPNTKAFGNNPSDNAEVPFGVSQAIYCSINESQPSSEGKP